MPRVIGLLALVALALGCADKAGPAATTPAKPAAKAATPADSAVLARLDALGDGALLVGVLDGRGWSKVHQRLTPVFSKLPAPAPAEFARVADMPGLLNTLLKGLFGAQSPLDLSALDAQGSVIVSLYEPATFGPPGAAAAHLTMGNEWAPLRHEIVLPATDAEALARALTDGMKTMCKPAAHGCDFGNLQVAVKADGDVVRLAALAPASAADAGPLLWPTPQPASVRTPAYTQLATPGAGASLLIRPWRLRAVSAQQGANAIAIALADAPADMEQQLFAYGLATVLKAAQLMHAERPDLEDAVLRLRADDAGIALEGTHVLAATTAKAFKAAIASGGRTLKLKVPVLAQISERVDLNRLLDGVGPRPIFAKIKRLRELARDWSECGSGCVLHTAFRVPLSTARGALDLAPPEAKAIVRALPTAMQGALVRLDENFKPIAALAGDVAKDFDTGQLRALPGSEVHLIPKDDRAVLLVGIGVDPRTVFDIDAATQTTTTSAARVEPAALEALARLLGAGPVKPLFDALGPIVAHSALAPGGHAFAWRIHFNTSPGVTASPFAPAATQAFAGPIVGFVAGEGDACLRDAIIGTSAAFEALAHVDPEQRAPAVIKAFGELTPKLDCAGSHASTKAAALGLRRLFVHLASMGAQHPQADVLAFADAQCTQTKDAAICAQAKRVKDLPPPAAPETETPAAPDSTNNRFLAHLAQGGEPLPATDGGHAAIGKLSDLLADETVRVDKRTPAAPVETRDKAMIRTVVQANARQAKYCFERSLVKNPKIGGKATVSFIAKPDGTTDAIVSEGDALPPEVHQCLVKRIETWRFPPAKTQTKITYPFIFKAQ